MQWILTTHLSRKFTTLWNIWDSWNSSSSSVKKSGQRRIDILILGLKIIHPSGPEVLPEGWGISLALDDMPDLLKSGIRALIGPL